VPLEGTSPGWLPLPMRAAEGQLPGVALEASCLEGAVGREDSRGEHGVTVAVERGVAMVRDVRTSCLAEMERGDGMSSLNVWWCGCGDTSFSADMPPGDPACESLIRGREVRSVEKKIRDSPRGCWEVWSVSMRK